MDRLRDAIETDVFRVYPEKRKNEVLGFLKELSRDTLATIEKESA